MVFVYLLVVAFILFVSPFLFAFIYVLRHYYRRVEIRGETPEEYELEFESLSYTSLDGIPLKAWWVKPDYLLSNETASGVIILIHGLLGMDASSMLGHAKFLQKVGYHLILPDMRGHGRSKGSILGLGMEECNDIIPLLDWIPERTELKGLPVVLLGIEAGAATAICTAASRDDVFAVVSLRCYTSFDNMLFDEEVKSSRVSRLLAPLNRFYFNSVIRLLYGSALSGMSPVKCVQRISPRPILIVHGMQDREISVNQARQLIGRAGEGVESWLIEDVGKDLYQGEVTRPENKQYRRMIWNFLSEKLPSRGIMTFNSGINHTGES